MTGQIGLHTFVDLIHEHWLSAFFLLLTLATILTLTIISLVVRRRMRGVLEAQFSEQHELDRLPPPGPRELESLELIKRFRREVWDMPESELQPRLDALAKRAAAIVRAIGGVYHPEAEAPEYEASLAETLQLAKRVSTRLTRLASTVPFKYAGDRKLSDFQRYYQVYLKINENPVLKLLKKNPHLYRAARLAMNVKNLANPLYWAGRELSREGYFYVLRWFHMAYTSEIGKEAIRLYSGKSFQREEDRDAALVCYRLFNAARKWGGPSDAEWAVFVGFVTSQPVLDGDTKLHILSRCADGMLPQDLHEQRVATKSGRKWYTEGLKRLLDADPGATPAKSKLIEREIEDMDQPAG